MHYKNDARLIDASALFDSMFEKYGDELNEDVADIFMELINEAPTVSLEPVNACTDCTGIMYRQTSSGKIIPADQQCGAKITPPCYQPDANGCAYQIYGDNNDEPIDKCKACPLCYSDKERHNSNAPLTLDELRGMDGDPVWIVFYSKTASHGIWEGWALVDTRFESMEFLEHNLKFSYYGKSWLAYRRKPEGSNTDA